MRGDFHVPEVSLPGGKVLALLAILPLAAILILGKRTPGVEQASAPQLSNAVLNELADGIPELPRQDVRAVTATLRPGAAEAWQTHPAPIYVYLLEGEAALEFEDGRMLELKPGQATAAGADTLMRTVNLSITKPAVFISFEAGDPKLAFAETKAPKWDSDDEASAYSAEPSAMGRAAAAATAPGPVQEAAVKPEVATLNEPSSKSAPADPAQQPEPAVPQASKTNKPDPTGKPQKVAALPETKSRAPVGGPGSGKEAAVKPAKPELTGKPQEAAALPAAETAKKARAPRGGAAATVRRFTGIWPGLRQPADGSRIASAAGMLSPSGVAQDRTPVQPGPIKPETAAKPREVAVLPAPETAKKARAPRGGSAATVRRVAGGIWPYMSRPADERREPGSRGASAEVVLPPSSAGPNGMSAALKRESEARIEPNRNRREADSAAQPEPAAAVKPQTAALPAAPETTGEAHEFALPPDAETIGSSPKPVVPSVSIARGPAFELGSGKQAAARREEGTGSEPNRRQAESLVRPEPAGTEALPAAPSPAMSDTMEDPYGFASPPAPIDEPHGFAALPAPEPIGNLPERRTTPVAAIDPAIEQGPVNQAALNPEDERRRNGARAASPAAQPAAAATAPLSTARQPAGPETTGRPHQLALLPARETPQAAADHQPMGETRELALLPAAEKLGAASERVVLAASVARDDPVIRLPPETPAVVQPQDESEANRKQPEAEPARQPEPAATEKPQAAPDRPDHAMPHEIASLLAPEKIDAAAERVVLAGGAASDDPANKPGTETEAVVKPQDASGPRPEISEAHSLPSAAAAAEPRPTAATPANPERAGERHEIAALPTPGTTSVSLEVVLPAASVAPDHPVTEVEDSKEAAVKPEDGSQPNRRTSEADLAAQPEPAAMELPQTGPKPTTPGATDKPHELASLPARETIGAPAVASIAADHPVVEAGPAEEAAVQPEAESRPLPLPAATDELPAAVKPGNPDRTGEPHVLAALPAAETVGAPERVLPPASVAMEKPAAAPRPVVKPREKPRIEPVRQAVVKPREKPKIEPIQEAAVKPKDKPASKPAPEAAAKDKPASKPSQEAAAKDKPASKPAPEAAAKDKPAAKPSQEAAAKAKEKPASDPNRKQTEANPARQAVPAAAKVPTTPHAAKAETAVAPRQAASQSAPEAARKSRVEAAAKSKGETGSDPNRKEQEANPQAPAAVEKPQAGAKPAKSEKPGTPSQAASKPVPETAKKPRAPAAAMPVPGKDAVVQAKRETGSGPNRNRPEAKPAPQAAPATVEKPQPAARPAKTGTAPQAASPPVPETAKKPRGEAPGAAAPGPGKKPQKAVTLPAPATPKPQKAATLPASEAAKSPQASLP